MASIRKIQKIRRQLSIGQFTATAGSNGGEPFGDFSWDILRTGEVIGVLKHDGMGHWHITLGDYPNEKYLAGGFRSHNGALRTVAIYLEYASRDSGQV